MLTKIVSWESHNQKNQAVRRGYYDAKNIGTGFLNFPNKTRSIFLVFVIQLFFSLILSRKVFIISDLACVISVFFLSRFIGKKIM